MQILNLDADLNISRLDADIRTLRLGEGGTTNYNDLTNKPSINSVVLTGNKTTSDLNIKTSDLINDEGFITNADIPTKTSDLTNDSGFQTAAQVSTAVAAAIPTNVSAFTNDAGYITAAQVGNIPTKTSDLTNDSSFITSAEAPVQSVNGYTGVVSLDGSNLDYSAALSINDKIDAVEAAIPTKTSDITNDSGFITSADITADVNILIQAAMPTTETIENESIASFSDGADNVPVSELIVNITATQAGSGTPSPSNPRAISGWNGSVITRCGTNIWDGKWEVGSISDSDGSKYQTYFKGLMAGTYGFVDLGSLTWAKLTGYPEFRTDYSANGIPVGKNQPGNVKSNLICTVYPAMSTNETYRGANRGVSLTNLYISVGDNTYSDADAFTKAMSGKYLIYELASSTTPTITQEQINMLISAFNADLVCVVFGQEVYGGTLNVTTGELTVTSGYIASYNGEAINGPWISSIDEYVPNTSPSTGAEVVYTLATPTTVQLTPTEVRTLLADNNIFADTGDVNKLVYFKTGCEAIARLIEAYT